MKIFKTTFWTTMIATLIFFLAKIFDFIDWSWWWVFSPLWLGWAIAGSILVIVLLCVFIAAFVQELAN